MITSKLSAFSFLCRLDLRGSGGLRARESTGRGVQGLGGAEGDSQVGTEQVEQCPVPVGLCLQSVAVLRGPMGRPDENEYQVNVYFELDTVESSLSGRRGTNFGKRLHKYTIR